MIPIFLLNVYCKRKFCWSESDWVCAINGTDILIECLLLENYIGTCYNYLSGGRCWIWEVWGSGEGAGDWPGDEAVHGDGPAAEAEGGGGGERKGWRGEGVGEKWRK